MRASGWLLVLAFSLGLTTVVRGEETVGCLGEERLWLGSAALKDPIVWAAISPFRRPLADSGTATARERDDASSLFEGEAVGTERRTARRSLAPREKLQLAIRNIVSPTRIAGTAISAGVSIGFDSPRQRGFGTGFDGYLARWGAQHAFWTSKDLVGSFALASLLNEDPRFQPSSGGRLWKRVVAGASGGLVLRAPSGELRFHASNVGGLAAAAGLSNLWHPSEHRGGKETLRRFAMALAVDAGVRVLSEFFLHRLGIGS